MDFDFDQDVTRVTDGKPAGLVKIRELKIEDEFIHDEKRWGLTTKEVLFGRCSTGHRVKVSGKWFVVYRHGNDNVTFKLEDPQNPFSKSLNEGDVIHLPYPGQTVTVLDIKNLGDARIAA